MDYTCPGKDRVDKLGYGVQYNIWVQRRKPPPLTPRGYDIGSLVSHQHTLAYSS